ncbi:MAG: hypothetical protein WCR67_04390 [Bacilli bacterium]
MNLKKAKKITTSYFEKVLSHTDYEIVEETDNFLKISLVLNITPLDNVETTAFIGVYKSGSAYIEFIFNPVKNKEEIFENVMKYNAGQCWFKGFTDEDDFFILIHNIISSDEKSFEFSLNHLFTNLVSDESIKLLKPITESLYTEEDDPDATEVSKNSLQNKFIKNA